MRASRCRTSCCRISVAATSAASATTGSSTSTRIAVTAEYRWYTQEYLDGAIFYDAGKAVSNRSQLDFSGLNHSYGAGIRLHGPRTTLLRIEVARSREGTRLIFAFSPVGG